MTPRVDSPGERLDTLVAIARLLGEAESVEQVFDGLMRELARHCSALSAALAEDRDGERRVSFWAPGQRPVYDLQAARTHLESVFACLAGTLPAGAWSAPEVPYLVLPLTTGSQPVFAALQIEGAGFPRDQVLFLEAVGGLLATALDRDRSLRRDAERRSYTAALESTLRTQEDDLKYAERQRTALLLELADDLQMVPAALVHLPELAQVVERHVADLRDLATLTRDAMQRRKVLMEISGILTAEVGRARASLAQRDQTLAVSLPDHPVFVEGDPAQIERVFSALLGDLSAAAGPGTPLRLDGRLDDDRGRLVVTLGCGAARPAPRARHRASRVVRRVVELHGGAVQSHRDQAAALEVSLPVAGVAWIVAVPGIEGTGATRS